jgi:hypothetical protein
MQTFPEPNWCDPSQPAEADCSSLVYTGPTPVILTGVFTRLIQYHFSDPNNISNSLLKEYVWTSNPDGCIVSGIDDGDSQGSSSSGSPSGCPEEATLITQGSRILVQPDYVRNNLTVQQRPAILITREPVQAQPISMRNASLPTIDSLAKIYKGQAHQVYISGRHTFLCYGLTGTEAELIASEVFYRMLNYMPLIRDDFRLGKFFVDGSGKIQAINDEHAQIFRVPVTVSWTYTYRWRIIPETPTIKRLALMFDTFDNTIL